MKVSWVVVIFSSLMLILVSLSAGSIVTAALIGLMAIPVIVKKGSYFGWMLLLSTGFLLLLTPLYIPYSRLALPLVLLFYIIGGVGIGWMASAWEDIYQHRPLRQKYLIGGAALLVIAAAVSIPNQISTRPMVRTWETTSGLSSAVDRIAADLPLDAFVIVYGEPAVAFYLQQNGFTAVPVNFPISHPSVKDLLSATSVKKYLVTGIYAEQRIPITSRELRRFKDSVKTQGIYPFMPGDVRILYDFKPEDAIRFRLNPTESMTCTSTRLSLKNKRLV